MVPPRLNRREIELTSLGECQCCIIKRTCALRFHVEPEKNTVCRAGN